MTIPILGLGESRLKQNFVKQNQEGDSITLSISISCHIVLIFMILFRFQNSVIKELFENDD